MEQLNRVELRGIVGEIRISPVGNAKVANFSVLTQHTFKAKDGIQVISDTWHKVCVWANTEPQAKYLARIKPNDLVFVSGRIKVRTFVRQDGAQATVHEIVASRVEILKEDILSPETDNKK